MAFDPFQRVKRISKAGRVFYPWYELALFYGIFCSQRLVVHADHMHLGPSFICLFDASGISSVTEVPFPGALFSVTVPSQSSSTRLLTFSIPICDLSEVFIHGDTVKIRFANGGYRHEGILSAANAVADRVFHKGLDR